MVRGSTTTLTPALPRVKKRGSLCSSFSDEYHEWLFSPVGVGQPLTKGQRKELGLDDSVLAVRVKYNPSPLKKDDVIVGLNGQKLRQSYSEFLAYIAQKTVSGQKLSVTVIRRGRQLEVVVKVPEEL